MTFEAGSMIKAMMMLGYLASEPYGDPNINSGFVISSPAFNATTEIPVIYTCKGQDISLPVNWSGVPKGTRSLALVMYDQDTPWPGFYHWELFNIPPSQHNLPADSHLAAGERLGANSWGKYTYGGPCPTQGEHHYVIRLYALDENLAISADKSPLELHRKMENHIIAWTQTTGHFSSA